MGKFTLSCPPEVTIRQGKDALITSLLDLETARLLKNFATENRQIILVFNPKHDFSKMTEEPLFSKPSIICPSPKPISPQEELPPLTIAGIIFCREDGDSALLGPANKNVGELLKLNETAMAKLGIPLVQHKTDEPLLGEQHPLENVLFFTPEGFIFYTEDKTSTQWLIGNIEKNHLEKHSPLQTHFSVSGCTCSQFSPTKHTRKIYLLSTDLKRFTGHFRLLLNPERQELLKNFGIT